MVSVANRPFIEHVLDCLVAHCDRIVLAVSFRADVLQSHFGDKYRGIPLQYSVESEPLGTGGAMLQAIRQFDLGRALVLNADTLFRIDIPGLVSSHLAAASEITIALRHMTDT